MTEQGRGEDSLEHEQKTEEEKRREKAGPFQNYLTLVHVARTLVEVREGGQAGNDTQHALLTRFHVCRDLHTPRH